MKIDIETLQSILCKQTALDIKLIQCHKDLICIDTKVEYPDGDLCSIHIQQIDDNNFRIVDDSNCALQQLPFEFKIHDNKIYFDTRIETLGSNLLKFIKVISEKRV